MRVKGAKKRVAIILAAALVVSGIGYVPKADAESVTQVTGDYSQEVNEICDTMEFVVTEPTFGSVGGEWAALILGRAGRMTEEWKQKYLAAVKSKMDGMAENLRNQNKLDKRKNTENSRAIIGLYSAGVDASDFNGWNVFAPISGDNVGGDKTEESQDYKDTIWQGINGPVYALIALDYAGYQSAGETKVTDVFDENTTTLRDDYIYFILENELADGGWALSGTSPDPDITMMTVQALSRYMYLPEVSDAVDRALTAMSEKQQPNGGYTSWGSENAEAISQVICGLTMLGIDPVTDERFIKNGNTLLDALKRFNTECVKDKVTYPEYHGYAHTLKEDGTGTYNQMASEQAGYTMVALWCLKKGQKLYQNGFRDIKDSEPTATPVETAEAEPTPEIPAESPEVSPANPVQSPEASPASPAESPKVSPASPAESPKVSPASPAESPKVSPASPAESPKASPASPAESPKASPASPAESPKASPVSPVQSPKVTPTIPAKPSQIPAPTSTPSASKIPQTTKAPQETKVPQTTKAPEETKAPEKTKAPQETKAPEATKVPNTTKTSKTTDIAKIVKKAEVKKGETLTIKAVVKGKKVKCKVSSYNKKALKVTFKDGKLVIKTKKKAKAGKTYKIVIKYKKGKKTVKKTVKITVK